MKLKNRFVKKLYGFPGALGSGFQFKAEENRLGIFCCPEDFGMSFPFRNQHVCDVSHTSRKFTVACCEIHDNKQQTASDHTKCHTHITISRDHGKLLIFRDHLLFGTLPPCWIHLPPSEIRFLLFVVSPQSCNNVMQNGRHEGIRPQRGWISIWSVRGVFEPVRCFDKPSRLLKPFGFLESVAVFFLSFRPGYEIISSQWKTGWISYFIIFSPPQAPKKVLLVVLVIFLWFFKWFLVYFVKDFQKSLQISEFFLTQ